MKLSTLKFLQLIFLILISLSISNVQAANINVISGGIGLSAGYSNLTGLSGLFSDLNNNPQPGQVIVISIAADLTSELNTFSLNANTWTSLTIKPSGHRTISNSFLSSTLLVFNGADHVTIDGLNDGTNSLEISNNSTSATAEASTLTFKGGASNNVITNCSILGAKGMDVATNGGVIYFAADALTANGNDNNVISNCNIGPESSALPSKCIYSSGSTSTTAIGNSGNIITNNNIFNYFKTNGESAGIYIKGGSNSWTISNNKFYQTATRTWTTGALHSAININDATAISGATGFAITGNTIGYSSNSLTGTYTLTGSAGSFAGIRFNGITAGVSSDISSNTFASISLSGVTSIGTLTNSPFKCIFISNGVAISNNNIVGSQSLSNSINFSSANSDEVDMFCIYNAGTDAWTSNNNQFGGIFFNCSGSSQKILFCMAAFNTSSWNANQNIIGGTIANSILGDGSIDNIFIYGMYASSTSASLVSNTVRNITSRSILPSSFSTAAFGIRVSLGGTSLVSNNTIFNLTGANAVYGIHTYFSQGTIENNFIYNLLLNGINSNAISRGIFLERGGPIICSNNMVALGQNENKPVSFTGIHMIQGLNTLYHNSILIGGSQLGNANSYSILEALPFNTLVVRDNIFMNVRTTTGSGTGKNYAIQISNTTNKTINNNVYYVSGAGTVFGRCVSDANNLTAWKTLVGQDAASLEGNPQFNDPLNAIPDLHLHPTNPTPAEGNGFDVGVTTDYDGQMRSGFTPVDIGADAINANRIRITLNAKLFLQGFYTSGGLMKNSGTGYLFACNVAGAGPSDVDTVFLSVMDNVPPYSLVDRQPGILKTNGDITVDFATNVLPNKQYYIKVEHQNSVETWSKLPVMFLASTDYSFRSAATQAYSDNMLETSDHFGWAIISGDVNQDSAVDAGDFLELDPMIQNGDGGYSNGDLNGDSSVDATDFLVLDPNVQLGYGSVHP